LQVRIFRFALGKMTKIFNESLQHYSELQQVRCDFWLFIYYFCWYCFNML